MAKPKEFSFLAPWEEIPGSSEGQKTADRLLSELKEEIPSKHLLGGLSLTAIATRSDQDDVLFEIAGSEEKLAVVHLTYRKETDPSWPDTQFFTSWQQWAETEMIPDHEDFTCGNTRVAVKVGFDSARSNNNEDLGF